MVGVTGMSVRAWLASLFVVVSVTAAALASPAHAVGSGSISELGTTMPKSVWDPGVKCDNYLKPGQGYVILSCDRSYLPGAAGADIVLVTAAEPDTYIWLGGGVCTVDSTEGPVCVVAGAGGTTRYFFPQTRDEVMVCAGPFYEEQCKVVWLPK